MARAMGAAPSRIDPQQSLLSLGLDSLIAVEVRNRVNADLGINLPLARFMQGATISTLAAYVAERLRDGAGPRVSSAEAPARAETREPNMPATPKRVSERIEVPTHEKVAAV
jgi:acyl carrier protein